MHNFVCFSGTRTPLLRVSDTQNEKLGDFVPISISSWALIVLAVVLVLQKLWHRTFSCISLGNGPGAANTAVGDGRLTLSVAKWLGLGSDIMAVQ